jgi:hypothetical protein
MRLVVNRQNSPGGISRRDSRAPPGVYESSFGIPDDRAVIRSLTPRGAAGHPSNGPAVPRRALDRLARTVVANAGWEGEAGVSSKSGPFKLQLPSLRLFLRARTSLTTARRVLDERVALDAASRGRLRPGGDQGPHRSGAEASRRGGRGRAARRT